MSNFQYKTGDMRAATRFGKRQPGLVLRWKRRKEGKEVKLASSPYLRRKKVGSSCNKEIGGEMGEGEGGPLITLASQQKGQVKKKKRSN